MPIVQMFKATKQSNRFNANQKVWIVSRPDNYYLIKFKYRGKGHYVGGRLDCLSKLIGEIKEIEVTEEFFNFLHKKKIK